MNLPESYKKRIKEQLGEEYEEYLRSFEQESESGLRVNTAKVSVDRFRELYPYEIERIPWVPNGYFYDEADGRPAVHPYYYAGLYYLQEPSAMTPASLLPVRPGERVLDLCAAPGGKSTELAARLKGQGVLVSNDVSSTRARALLKNLELFGTPNALVVSETPQKLAGVFTGYFDKILVDAPCSGEGMFRKKAAIMKNWEQYGTGYYHDLQSQIMPFAVQMLRPGGMLLYSTCTFSPEEDEGTIQEVLDAFPETELVDATKYAAYGCDFTGFCHGDPGAVPGGSSDLEKTLRLWPHKIRGEGHFIALLRKKGPEDSENEESACAGILPAKVLKGSNTCETGRSAGNKKAGIKPARGNKVPEEAVEFLQKIDYPIDITRIIQRGEQLFMLPELGVSTDGLRILRSGLLLGEVKTKRFEPSQALACALPMSAYDNVLNLKSDDDRVLKYLKCETIDVPEKLENGFCLVCVDGFPLGWGKYANGNFKNRYLAGWRHM